METQTCQTNTKGDEDKKQSSSVTLTDGLSETASITSEKVSLALATDKNANLGGLGIREESWCNYADR